MPRVTIGLPVHNAGKYLELALRSIYAQSYKDWELIVVDDGSTDDGVDLVRQLDDGRVRILGDGKRRGLATRLNEIAYAANGYYLARMDADDLMHPLRLEEQVAFLDAHPGIDVVGCALLFLDRELRPAAIQRNPEAHEQICADALRAIRMAHATMVARTAWFRAHPYNERNLRCEDWQLLYDSRSQSRYANLQDPLYFYRVFESFSIRKYCARKLQNAHLCWDLPPSECSRSRALGLTLRNYFDMGVYTLARAAGQHDRLIRRRGEAISAAEAEDFAEILRTVRSCPLPIANPPSISR